MSKRLRRLTQSELAREYSIRFRLLRASLSRESLEAERRADAFLISYPKCGRTWLRVLLSNALALHAGVEEPDHLAEDLLGNAASGLPRIRVSHDDSPQWKSARRLQRSKQRFSRKQVVLLVRDPRDVVVSMYFERTKRERAYSKSLHAFVREPRGSLDTIIAYYNIWAQQRSVPADFCLLRYEDLRSDTATELSRLLDFLGIQDVSSAHIAEAIRFASFGNMRDMEKRDALKSGRLRARDPKDVESFKTRRGLVGGYTDYLSDDEIEWMELRIREELDPYFGYEKPARLAACDAKNGAA